MIKNLLTSIFLNFRFHFFRKVLYAIKTFCYEEENSIEKPGLLIFKRSLPSRLNSLGELMHRKLEPFFYKSHLFFPLEVNNKLM